MDHAEKVARIILEAALPGAFMEFRPEQSNKEYDFYLRYPNGEVAAVEATASRNQFLAQTNAEVYKKKKGGPVIDAVECKKSWIIFLSRSAQVKEIRKNADKCLAELEAAGLESFSCYRDSSNPLECIRKIIDDLRLTSGNVISSTEAPAKIHIVGFGGGGAVIATHATEAGEEEAEANKEKLGKAGTDERHLVVYIDLMNGVPYTALTAFDPPLALPNLPDEITHIWLVTEYEGAGQFVVWHGSKTEPWRRVILPLEVNPNGADSSTSPTPQ
jgi:hypothetical protein